MLVKDLRTLISKYNNEEKDKIIIELYKRIPKSIKENYSLDDYISNIENNDKLKKEEKILSIDELEKEVEYFLTCARNNLYCSPNKIIPKAERSKWRFKVKKFCKELITFAPDTKEGTRATNLLKSLYEILSIGSVYLTFSNWDTFRAVQISQEDFLSLIMKRVLTDEVSKDSIAYCAKLLDVEYDPQGYHKYVLLAFVNCLKDDEMRRVAIEVLSDMIKVKQEKLKSLRDSTSIFYLEERINYLVKCILYAFFELKQVEKGISYYHANYIESDKEIKEYIILGELESFKLYDEWIKEYEKHSKIRYRQSLREKYEEIKNSKI